RGLDGLRALEEREHLLDVPLRRRMAEDAEPHGGAPVDTRRRDEAEPTRLERGDELVGVVPATAEAHDPERRLRDELERVARLDQSARMLGEVERPVDRRTERVDAERR